MSGFPKIWTEALFKRLALMYGSKWSALWDGVPMADVMDAWQEDLAGVNGEQVKRALAHLKSNNPFPPTLPEFLSLCRQFRVKESNVLYLPAARTVMPDHVRAALAKLRHGK